MEERREEGRGAQVWAKRTISASVSDGGSAAALMTASFWSLSLSIIVRSEGERAGFCPLSVLAGDIRRIYYFKTSEFLL